MHPISAEPFPLERDACPDPLRRGCGQRRRGSSNGREADGGAAAQPDLTRANAPAAAHGVGAEHRDRHDRSAGFERQATHAAAWRSERPGPHAGALGKDHYAVAAAQDRPSGRHRFDVARTAVDREGAERAEHPRLPALCEQLALGDVIDRPTRERTDHERVEEAAMVGREQQRAGAWNVLGAIALQTEIDEEERQQDRPRRPVENRVHAARDGASPKALQGLVLAGRRCSVAETSGGLARHVLDTRARPARYSGARWRSTEPRRFEEPSPAPSRRGSGPPRCPSTSGSSAPGSTTSNCSARRSRAEPRGRWPAGLCICRTERCSARSTPTSRPAFHCPRGRAVPWRRWERASRRGRCSASPTACTPRARSSQQRLPIPVHWPSSTWRHLLFGVVLGELERRLNAPEQIEPPDYPGTVSSNGHGHIEHLAAVP